MLISSADNLMTRRKLMRDVLAATGWVFLSSAELVCNSTPVIAGDPKNQDKDWGAVKGRIVFDGEVPERKEVDLVKAGFAGDDLKWFSSMGPILNEEWVIDKKSKAVQWVFLWLLPDPPMGMAMKIHESLKVIPAKDQQVVIDQLPQGYSQHAVGLRAGQDLLMKNTGPVAHVFNMSEGSNNAGFNVSMPSKSEYSVPKMKAERTPLQVNCPPHPWERLWLRVFDHPYFAVTKADGTFEIPFVPAGDCRIVVWQESLGFKNGKEGRNGSLIKVVGGASTDLGDITIKPKD
jgi:hypothetical protein